VRRADARSAKIDRPDGVFRAFQVSLYNVEPLQAIVTSNLLAKRDVRAILFDEAEQVWPQVPLVAESGAFACDAERLTGTRACPDGPVVWPACAA
jgi:hypothetical protein